MGKDDMCVFAHTLRFCRPGVRKHERQNAITPIKTLVFIG